MNESDIQKTIIELLKRIAPDTQPGTLKPDDNIRTTLEIDSFDYLQFIVALDEHFSIDTPEEDYGKIETISSLTKYLQEKASTPTAGKS